MTKQLKIFYKEPLDDRLRIFLKNSDKLLKGDIESCDLIVHESVLWGDKETKAKLRRIPSNLKDVSKKEVVFIVNDFEYRYKSFDNLILLRTSRRSSKRRANEYVLPYTWECSSKPFPVAPNTSPPLGSFCGLSGKYRKKF